MTALTCVSAWHAARGQALARLEELTVQIRKSNDPEAADALVDLAPMIRLLRISVADLVTVRAVESQWRNDPAWQDLQDQAPDILDPLRHALKDLSEALRRA